MIEEENGYITRIELKQRGCSPALGSANQESSPALAQCKRELTEYFAGKRTEFTISINPIGTPFQMKVWEELKNINYGEVISYKELALRIGNPKAVRAVGGANSKNPLMIVIPCHRVIGANGALVGYGGGGTKNKEWLINLEKEAAKNFACYNIRERR